MFLQHKEKIPIIAVIAAVTHPPSDITVQSASQIVRQGGGWLAGCFTVDIW